MTLLEHLKRDGYVRTTAKHFIGQDAYEDLRRGVVDLREAGLQIDTPLTDASKSKTYLRRWLGSSPVFDASTPWAKVAMETPILDIAKAYIPDATLYHYNIWQTLVCEQPPFSSQLWHRDYEDRIMLKVFLYLTDVDAGAGPLWYLPGTHSLGHRKNLRPSASIVDRVLRTSDKQMAAKVPESEWVELTGPAGTLLLVDTAGYHKGGYATERERWLYTCQFCTSKAKKRAGPPFLPEKP